MKLFRNFSRRSLYILIITAAVIVIVASIFALYMTFTPSEMLKNENIKINYNKKTIEDYNVKLDTINPGESTEYHIYATTDGAGIYTFSLSFAEEDDGGLACYIAVDIYTDTQTIAQTRLDDLFRSEEPIVFDEALDDGSADLYIRYTMDLSAGNETMNTYSDFKLTVEANMEK